MLFFTLSGLVLALPYVHGRAQPYPIYLGRRILRIYGPYLAALALSILGATYFHGPHAGWAGNFWSQPISLPLVLQHIAFLGVYDYDQYNFVIWSLIFELRISILFPILCTRTLRRGPFVAIPLFLLISFACAGLIGTASAHTFSYSYLMTFHYMAFFVLGILIAANLTPIRNWYKRLNRPLRALLFLASLAAYNLSGRISDHFASLSIRVLGDWGVVLGAIGYILLALNSPLARRVLTAAIPTFLGRISYSLYLLHAPILLALTFSPLGHLTPWAQFPIYLAASLVAATLFNRAIEEPFIGLGRRLGRFGMMSP
jgi:peptidoglycan/LPS O-acetylase OafA/YrhL